MMLKAGAYEVAYEDYARALELDRQMQAPSRALSGGRGLAPGIRAGSLLARGGVDARPAAPAIRSRPVQVASGGRRLRRSSSRRSDAIEAAPPRIRMPLEQLASLYADTETRQGLTPVVNELQQRFPDRAASMYYAAALHFMRR